MAVLRNEVDESVIWFVYIWSQIIAVDDLKFTNIVIHRVQCSKLPVAAVQR